MNTHISKGTRVRIHTTNGGRTTVKLLEDYRPSGFSVACETDYGHPFIMSGSRIKSIDVVINYWTAPLTEQEAADIRGRLAFRRGFQRGA